MSIVRKSNAALWGSKEILDLDTRLFLLLPQFFNLKILGKKQKLSLQFQDYKQITYSMSQSSRTCLESFQDYVQWILRCIHVWWSRLGGAVQMIGSMMTVFHLIQHHTKTIKSYTIMQDQSHIYIYIYSIATKIAKQRTKKQLSNETLPLWWFIKKGNLLPYPALY